MSVALEGGKKYQFPVEGGGGHEAGAMVSGLKKKRTPVGSCVTQPEECLFISWTPQDRKSWVEALGGTWPAVNTLQGTSQQQ